ncbi:hypothetical protein MMC29_005542 [Sticta canariensis]|nr:hypothetical protein [Sticta canariensis]
MGDTWVLSEIGKALHRRLLKKLDSESALTSTFEYPDTWRTRFRECKIEFHMPPHQHIHVDKSFMYNPAFTSVKISDTADVVAFIINERPSPDYGCTLLFDRLGLFHQPIDVGATQYSKCRFPSVVPRIQNIVTNRLSRAWVLKLKIELTVASYLVTSSEAFAKDDDQFKLLPLGYSLPEEPVSARTNGDDKQMIDAIVETLNSVSNMWVFLACLPNAVAYEGWIEKDTRRARELVIAKHIKTGGLFILEDTPRATRTVGSDCACGSYDVAMTSAVRGQVGDTQSCISVQGKRISSIAPHMSGIHPSSPLRDLPDTQTRIHIDEDALGGVQLFCDPDQRGEHAERCRGGCLVQTIMVWGRSNKGDSHITLRIFDLSFAVPSRLRWYQTFSHWTAVDTSPHQKTYCTCPLHDEGFRVMLPDPSCHTLSYHPSYLPSSRPKSALSSLLVSS